MRVTPGCERFELFVGEEIESDNENSVTTSGMTMLVRLSFANAESNCTVCQQLEL